ncbi:MAG TPA: hypothetical protein VMT10_07305 [Solirubrobacteraceae bacterium]|nr:hypothetical protein [Solirubrobacteraceae bacterium]
MRTDPTDNGGLFVGRRPGTKPVRYRVKPVEGDARARRRDAVLAALILAAMIFVNLLFWGPIEVAWLWIVSHVPPLPDHIFFALVVAFIGILLTLMGALVVLKQLDRAWILVRRAAGVDQRSGVIGRVFLYTGIVGATLFSIWLIFGGGLAQSLNPPST